MFTYKDAGVDIDKADSLLGSVKDFIKTTFDKNVTSDLSSFSGEYKFHNHKLLATTDGVGTKLKLAFELGIHDTVGIDLVAMCVNDIYASFGNPLFFLDYFASGNLEKEVYVDVIKGIVNGCKEAKCALIGGETAEMPDMYSDGEYDLAGFCVGVQEYEPEEVVDGDWVVGIPSSGLHSNGFSLVRKIMKPSKELLTPTRIYTDLPKAKARAHITGGGIIENLKRIVKGASLVKGSWPVTPIFHDIARKAKLNDEEMLKTFNCGIGFAYVVSEIEETLDTKDHYIIGRVQGNDIEFRGHNIF